MLRLARLYSKQSQVLSTLFTLTNFQSQLHSLFELCPTTMCVALETMKRKGSCFRILLYIVMCCWHEFIRDRSVQWELGDLLTRTRSPPNYTAAFMATLGISLYNGWHRIILRSLVLDERSGLFCMAHAENRTVRNKGSVSGQWRDYSAKNAACFC